MKRKTHQKSRRGCLTCKNSRVKCDEQKPICERCAERSLTCTYPTDTPSLRWQHSTTPKLPRSAAPHRHDHRDVDLDCTSSHTQAALPDQDIQLKSLVNANLIVHWFTSTVFTVHAAEDHRVLETSQTLVLREAVKQDFLMHGLLALSAMHLADAEPGSHEYREIAMAHHSRGLNLYRSILDRMTVDCQVSAVAFAGLTVIFTFASLRPDPIESNVDPLSGLVQVFRLAKGWLTVVREVNRPAAEASLSRLSQSEHCTAADWKSIEEAFEKLQDLVARHARATLYRDMIKLLKQIFASQISEGCRNPHLVVHWAYLMPSEFLDLLETKDETALILVAYYSVTLDCFTEFWWLRGWGKALFDFVDARLADYIDRGALEWPRQMIMRQNFTDLPSCNNLMAAETAL